jgi:hypothetical protein
MVRVRFMVKSRGLRLRLRLQSSPSSTSAFANVTFGLCTYLERCFSIVRVILQCRKKRFSFSHSTITFGQSSHVCIKGWNKPHRFDSFALCILHFAHTLKIPPWRRVCVLALVLFCDLVAVVVVVAQVLSLYCPVSFSLLLGLSPCCCLCFGF